MSSDPQAVVKRLREDAELTVQVGREGPILGEPTGFVSSRCPTIDYLIGRPGIPLGGITLFVGAYGTGKSTICQHILAETQAQGGQAVLFDTEGRFNFGHAQKLGIDMDKLIVAQPNTLEEMFAGVKQMIEVAREVLGEEDMVVIVVDSIAGAPLEKDVKGEKVALGAQSLLIRRELRVLTMLVNRQRIGLVIVSQPRQRINIGHWGRPERSWLGEDPLGHAAMTTILLEEKGKIGEDPKSPLGYHIMATNVDTRIAGCDQPECLRHRRKEFRRDFEFYSATGPDYYGSALDVLQEEKVVSYKNGWYTFEDRKPFRRKEMQERMEEWPELKEALATILVAGGGHGET